MSIETVQSSDGTRIAFETDGKGPPLILVGGAFCDRRARASGTPLAALLSSRFTVFSYDRRGRGDSGDTPPYGIEREVQDLAALVERAGGAAYAYGISSGAMLVLEASLAGVPISRVALYEPPIQLEASRAEAMGRIVSELDAAIAAGRRGDAAEIFLTKVVQVPAPVVGNMRRAPFWAGLEALAHTLSFDVKIAARALPLLERGGSVPAVTLALCGEASPPWMREGVGALANAIPRARLQVLAGQTHDVDVKVLATELEGFFGGSG
jgi:pimeloyl-ACP methyl ester carboxylesterase